MTPPPEYPRALHGFRFSNTDAVVLIATAIASVWLAVNDVPLWWMLPLVVGHFFLFCNVFRVRRSYELIWGLILLINCACWLLNQHFNWQPVVLAQLPFTAAAISFEMRSSAYHGIFAHRINPSLEDYLKKRIQFTHRHRGGNPEPEVGQT
jgi:hypothetical protein